MPSQPSSAHSAAPADPLPRTARDLGVMQGFPPPPEKRPDRANWDLPPFNRWSFQNMRRLFPTADTRRAGPVRALPERPAPELLTLPVATVSGAEKTLERILDETYCEGFLIAHRGEVLVERFANAMTPATPHLAQSVSKSVVGALAGVLHGEGLLDLSAPLSDLIPELSGRGYGDATLDQALDMRSGVGFSEDYGAPDSDMTRLDVASLWRPARAGEAPLTIRDLIPELSAIRPHGGVFDYRSIETDVIAWALERAARMALPELLSDRIWSRIGAEHDGFFTVDAAGTALADGGFNATLRDFARFGLMMLEGGRVGQAQVVPEAWIEATRKGDASVFGAPYDQLSPRGAYRRQWWIHDVERGDIMARGVFGQLIYLDPRTDFMAVALSSWPDYLIPAYGADMLRGVLAARRALSPDS